MKAVVQHYAQPAGSGPEQQRQLQAAQFRDVVDYFRLDVPRDTAPSPAPAYVPAQLVIDSYRLDAVRERTAAIVSPAPQCATDLPIP